MYDLSLLCKSKNTNLKAILYIRSIVVDIQVKITWSSYKPIIYIIILVKNVYDYYLIR